MLFKHARGPRRARAHAGHRAEAGDRLGRGLYARPRSPAARVVPCPSRPGAVRRRMEPHPLSSWCSRSEQLRLAPIRSIPVRSCSSTPRSWPISGRSPVRSHTGILPSMHCSALSAIFSRPPGKICHVPAWVRFCSSACTAGFLFHFMARRWGVGPAIVAVAAWTFQPNLFGHGHYATYDAVLSCHSGCSRSSRLRAAVASARAGASRRQWPSCDSGIRAGRRLRAGDQADRLVPPAAVSWSGPAWARDRRALRVLMIGLPLACAVLFLLNARPGGPSRSRDCCGSSSPT